MTRQMGIRAKMGIDPTARSHDLLWSSKGMSLSDLVSHRLERRLGGGHLDLRSCCSSLKKNPPGAAGAVRHGI